MLKLIAMPEGIELAPLDDVYSLSEGNVEKRRTVGSQKISPSRIKAGE